MSRKVAWVTGANGLIGGYIVAHAPPDYDARPIIRERIDLLDFARVRQLWKQDDPMLVIHCAAISKSVACQQQPELARKTNVDLTGLLSELARDRSLVFFSSDLVFDGREGNYSETDAVNPLTLYAQTKVEAEGIVLRNPTHTVIRTSLNAGISRSGDRAFNEEMRRAWEVAKTLNLFTDEFRCPIPAAVTAKAVWALVKSKAGGLFHLAGAERLSRYEIGRLLAKDLADLSGRIIPCSLRDYRGPPRSADTSLNCEKVQALLPFALPRFSEWLAHNRL
jgi:dTDP-4-dehydrorhamnose reductase